jgi:hypothetical protein
MSFKAFEESETQPLSIVNDATISLSKNSPCASHIHFFTGIKTLGDLGSLQESTFNPTFGLNRKDVVRYKWQFDTTPLPNQDSITAEKVTGVFISTADQTFLTQSGNSSISHQNIFEHVRGYLYRNDNSYNAESASALNSTSSASQVSVVRNINFRRDINSDAIRPTTFYMEMNTSNTSLTGYVSGPSAQSTFLTSNVTGYTAALDLKNPNGGFDGTTTKSFFGVGVTNNPYTASGNLDSVSDSITVEAVIRPYRSNSTILFRRLANSGDSKTRNKFLKLELTSSPDGQQPAFRFYLRDTTVYSSNVDSEANKIEADFAEDFADRDVQCSGLFVPSDVGVNLFDGQFHHIVATWSIYELGEGEIRGSVDRGSGVVLGYIDGYKLLNKEQVFPRLQGSDEANGPVTQANMLEQRIPVRTVRLQSSDPISGPSGNNVYIGASNFNREDGVNTGDRGDIVNSTDANIAGLYDGQIQSIRMWNIRLKDGSTGFKDKVNQKMEAPSLKQASGSAALNLTYHNFMDSTLTSASANNIMAWWHFNSINTVSASDIAGGLTGAVATMLPDPFGNVSSSTGAVVGDGITKLYDHNDITLSVSGNEFTDLSSSGINRTFLYYDQPLNIKEIDNDFSQGRIVRKTVEGTIKKVGMIFYDISSVVLDGDDANAKLNFTWPASGVTGDFGFAVTGHNHAALSVERVRFSASNFVGRLLVDAVASGSEFNFTENNTGRDIVTGESVFDNPTSFISTVGLYNDNGDLLAVAKLAKPVKKDENITLAAQVDLDF